jgi:hypothetical protein
MPLPSLLHKHEFIATEATSTCFQPGEVESSFPVKIKYFFRLCDLKGITTNPIHEIIPDGHTSVFFLLGPRFEGERVLPLGQPN